MNPFAIALIGVSIALLICAVHGNTPMAADAEEVKLSEPCMSDEARERVRALMIDALDDGLHDQIKNLFNVWLKEPDKGQPGRAAVGTRQAIRAHQMARKAAADWNPPECSP